MTDLTPGTLVRINAKGARVSGGRLDEGSILTVGRVGPAYTGSDYVAIEGATGLFHRSEFDLPSLETLKVGDHVDDGSGPEYVDHVGENYIVTIATDGDPWMYDKHDIAGLRWSEPESAESLRPLTSISDIEPGMRLRVNDRGEAADGGGDFVAGDIVTAALLFDDAQGWFSIEEKKHCMFALDEVDALDGPETRPGVTIKLTSAYRSPEENKTVFVADHQSETLAVMATTTGSFTETEVENAEDLSSYLTSEDFVADWDSAASEVARIVGAPVRLAHVSSAPVASAIVGDNIILTLALQDGETYTEQIPTDFLTMPRAQWISSTADAFAAEHRRDLERVERAEAAQVDSIQQAEEARATKEAYAEYLRLKERFG